MYKNSFPASCYNSFTFHLQHVRNLDFEQKFELSHTIVEKPELDETLELNENPRSEGESDLEISFKLPVHDTNETKNSEETPEPVQDNISEKKVEFMDESESNETIDQGLYGEICLLILN